MPVSDDGTEEAESFKQGCLAEIHAKGGLSVYT